MSDKPALLIDVDGVLCPFGPECPEGYTLVPMEDGAAFEYIQISPANGDRLERLAQTFDLVWCTGWEHRANEYLLEHHRLPGPLPVIEFFRKSVPGITLKFSGVRIHDDRFKMAHWKMPWVDAWANETSRPLAWVDDEVGAADLDWAEERTAAGIPTLVLPTHYMDGLLDAHVEKLEEWYGTLSNNGERD